MNSTQESLVDKESTTSPTAALAVAFLALFTDMLVYGLAVPILPSLAESVGAGAGTIGALFACYALGFLGVTPLAGRLVDRFGPRRPLLIGVAGLAAATCVFGLSEGLFLLVVARLLQGVSAAFSWVAALALVASTTPMATRGRSLGIAISGMTTGLLLGPPLGGVLADSLGLSAPFLVASILALVVGALYLVLIRHAPTASDDPAGPLDVLRVPGSKAVVLIALLAAATIAIIEPVLPLNLSQRFDADSTAIGALFALTVIVGIVLAPVAGSLIGRIRTSVLVGTGAFLAGASLLVLGVATSLWQVALAMSLLGIAYGPLLQTPATVLIGVQGQRSDPPALGGSYALYNFAFGGGLFLGPLVGSLPTELLGFTIAMIVSAAIVALVGLLSASRLPSLY